MSFIPCEEEKKGSLFHGKEEETEANINTCSDLKAMYNLLLLLFHD